MPHRSGAAGLAAHHVGGRLHRQPPLAVHLELGPGDEALHSQKRGRALTTVHPHRGSHSLLPWTAATMARPLSLLADPYATTDSASRTTLNREDPSRSPCTATVPPVANAERGGDSAQRTPAHAANAPDRGCHPRSSQLHPRGTGRCRSPPRTEPGPRVEQSTADPNGDGSR